VVKLYAMVNAAVVPNADMGGGSAAGMNGGCDVGDCPMGSGCLNEVTRGRVVDENIDDGWRGCPTD
jgi:hypothetical protein